MPASSVQGERLEPRVRPRRLVFPGAAIAVAAGDDFSCALLADGRVFCWGGGARGQLGTGDGRRAAARRAAAVALPAKRARDRGRQPTRLRAARERGPCLLGRERRRPAWPRRHQGPDAPASVALGTGPRQLARQPRSHNLRAARRSRQSSAGAATRAASWVSATRSSASRLRSRRSISGPAARRRRSPSAARSPARCSTPGRRSAGATTGPISWARRCGARRTATGQRDGRLLWRRSSGRRAHRCGAIAAGRVHACAILDTGDVRCWGDNGYGQLGAGDAEAHSPFLHPTGVVDLGAAALMVHADVAHARSARLGVGPGGLRWRPRSGAGWRGRRRCGRPGRRCRGTRRRERNGLRGHRRQHAFRRRGHREHRRLLRHPRGGRRRQRGPIRARVRQPPGLEAHRPDRGGHATRPARRCASTSSSPTRSPFRFELAAGTTGRATISAAESWLLDPGDPPTSCLVHVSAAANVAASNVTLGQAPSLEPVRRLCHAGCPQRARRPRDRLPPQRAHRHLPPGSRVRFTTAATAPDWRSPTPWSTATRPPAMAAGSTPRGFGAVLVVYHSSIVNNTAAGAGGGLYFGGGWNTHVIRASTVSGNRANVGGGVMVQFECSNTVPQRLLEHHRGQYSATAPAAASSSSRPTWPARDKT